VYKSKKATQEWLSLKNLIVKYLNFLGYTQVFKINEFENHFKKWADNKHLDLACEMIKHDSDLPLCLYEFGVVEPGTIAIALTVITEFGNDSFARVEMYKTLDLLPQGNVNFSHGYNDTCETHAPPGKFSLYNDQNELVNLWCTTALATLEWNPQQKKNPIYVFFTKTINSLKAFFKKHLIFS
jgi:hypothetical protein